jgi:Acyl-coenzyme A:6-aminopenicillanic acid acyl-transferase
VEEPEVNLGVTSSHHRHDTHQQLGDACTKAKVIQMLGDQSNSKWPIYREGIGEDFVKTVAVGIFDCVHMTWSLYTENPKISSPVVVLPLQLK